MMTWEAVGAHLRVLIAKVAIQASRAISRVAVKPFCLSQMLCLYGQAFVLSDSTHAHLSSVRAWKARLRLADSKTMKARSRKMSDILALCDRRPRGFDVYSS